MSKELELPELRRTLSGLFRINKRAYWTDFLLHAALGYTAFAGACALPVASVWTWGLYIIAAFALYRASLFIHEIAHFRTQIPIFSKWWNILCGVPLAMPSFLYYQSHFTHHRAQTYGTAGDGEYVAFALKPRWEMVRYLFLSAIAPLLLLFRFVVLVPISYSVPSVRRWVIAHGSSLIIEAGFVGAPPNEKEAKEWLWQEWSTFAVWAIGLTLVAVGVIPGGFLFSLLVLMSTVHVVNGLRTLAAHRFENAGGAMTVEQQYLDSVNLTGTGWRAVVNTLAAPVGLRYHAIHHLFPGIPYHGLGEAHRRLVAALPTDSAYHLANDPSIATSLLRLWNEAKKSQRQYRLELQS